MSPIIFFEAIFMSTVGALARDLDLIFNSGHEVKILNSDAEISGKWVYSNFMPNSLVIHTALDRHPAV